MLPIQSTGDSLNELMARHDGLVQAIVRRQVLGDMPFAEGVYPKL